MRRTLFVSAALILMSSSGLAAAQTVQPVPGPTAAAGRAVIQYSLPRTVPEVTITAHLVSCDGADARVDYEVQIKMGSAPGQLVRATNNGLSSWRIKRDVEIGLTSDGRLDTLNSVDADQTGPIISDVVKTALNFAGMALPAPAPAAGAAGAPPVKRPDPCTPRARAALDRIGVIQSNLNTLNILRLDANGDPVMSDDRAKAVAALREELAALRAGDLTITIVRKVDLDPLPATTTSIVIPVSVAANDLRQWFKATPASVLPALSLTASIQRAATFDPEVKPGCRLSMPAPAPAYARFELSGPDISTVTEEAPVQQWGGVNNICLDVGFFSSRTLAVDWNEYGVITKFHWISNSTLSALTSVLASSSKDVSDFVNDHPPKAPPTPAEEAKAAADLATEQARALRAQQCLALLQAGSNCPEGDAQ